MQKQADRISRNKKNDNKNKDTIILFTKSLIIQTVVYIVISFVSLIFDINTNDLFLICLCAFSLSSLISGFVTGRTKRCNGLVNGMLYSLPSIILFAFISACLNSFKIDFTAIISILCMLVFSSVGGVISVNVKKRTKIKRWINPEGKYENESFCFIVEKSIY